MSNAVLDVIINLKDEASKKLSGVKNSFSDVEKSAIKMVGSFVAVDKVIGFLSSATQPAIEFDKEMRRVNTITRLNEEQFKQLGKSILETSKYFPFSAKELSNGLFDVASAGIEAENQLAFLQQSAMFATAGTTDLNTSVAGLTAIIKGWGLQTQEATRVSDLFFKTNELGQTTVGAVASSIQAVTAQAKISGLQLEELFAVYATFTGVTGNASEVTTQLKGALNALSAPTTESSAKFKELGVEVGKTAIEKKGFAKVAKEVYDAVGGDAEALRKLVPEVNASQMIIALATTQYDDFNDKLLQLNDSVGATGIAFAEMQKSTAVQLQMASNNFAIAKTAIGDSLSGVLLFVSEFTSSMARSLAFAGNFIKTTFKNITEVLFATAKGISNLISKITGETPAYANILDEMNAKLKKNFDQLSTSLRYAGTDSKQLNIEFTNAKRTTQDLANSTKELGDKFSGFGDKTNDITNKVKKLDEGYYDFLVKTKENIQAMASDHSKALESIRNDIEKTKSSIATLTEQYEKQKAQDTASVADKVVQTEQRVADIQKELQGQVTEERRLQLEAELAQQQQALIANADFIKSIETEVLEAKRRAKLTDLERTIEDYKKKRELALKEYEDKKKDLENEIALLVQKEKDEITAYNEKMKIMKQLLEIGDRQHQASQENRLKATKETVEKEIFLMQQLADAVSKVRKTDTTDLSSFIENVRGVDTNLGTQQSSSATGNNINITINGDVSGEDIAEKMGDILVKKLKLNSAII